MLGPPGAMSSRTTWIWAGTFWGVVPGVDLLSLLIDEDQPEPGHAPAGHLGLLLTLAQDGGPGPEKDRAPVGILLGPVCDPDHRLPALARLRSGD